MGIKDRFFSNSKKQADKIENPPTIDIQPVSTDETSPQAINQQSNIKNKLPAIVRKVLQKEEIHTEATIAEVEERLENTSNSRKIKNVFYQLVKSVNPQDIPKYIQKITEKLPSMNRGPIKEIWSKVQSLFQMVIDPKVAWKSKALAIGSLLYLISPFDAIPDIIPIAGLTDDAAVIISVVSTLAVELSKYARQSANKGIEVAEELADIEVRKYNRIVKITLIGSIIAAILAIAVKIILKHI